ncbi:unnamed protein product [Prorocentrum cordatum]|uniref:Uncharacterized protein n=1 Tax=Prorocentrum cordatum TaxID=2364126 RepID=A0ABN9TEF9_9DINO|nr:unnamed protein product [Polarella glacialis]
MCGTTDGACGGDCFLATTEEQIVAVDRGACDGDPLERLGSASACQEAAKALGYAIDWGPSGGFVDVVDGCSVRNDTMLFYNAGGTCSLTRGPKANGGFFRKCQCSEHNKCLCRRPRGPICKPQSREVVEGLDELLGELSRLERGLDPATRRPAGVAVQGVRSSAKEL